MKKKIIVYSANFGDYDTFNSPTIYDKNIKYILFTDNKEFKSNVWEIINYDFNEHNLSSRKKSRFIKLNPHKVLPEHDISIWIDHCFTPKFSNVENLLFNLNFNENSSVMIYKHSWRTCLYDEAKEVIKKKLDDEKLVQIQMQKYDCEGFKKNQGLFETGFIVRKNNDNVNSFNETWWHEVFTWSGRDQLSNVYASWKTNLNIDTIKFGESIYKNSFLETKRNHLRK